MKRGTHMKTARRVFSLLLVLAMVFALVACGGSSETTDTDSGSKKTTSNAKPNSGSQAGNEDTENTDGTDVSQDTGSGEGPTSTSTITTPVTGTQDLTTNTEMTEDTFEPADHNADDFADKIYTIIQHESIDTPFKYSQDSALGSQVADRIVEVQSKYGCELVFSQIAYGSNFATEMQGLQFADDGGDMVFSSNNAQLRKTLGIGEDSLMVDLLTVDDIINFWDFNKWGNITARETMMSGGKFFGVSPALWIEATPLPFFQVAYNKDLVESFGITDPQEFWENEEWDRDNMMDLISSCYDDTTGMAIWGMTADLGNMIRGTALTTGATVVEIGKIYANGDVDWSLGLMSKDVEEALQWLKNNLSVYAKYFNNGKETWTKWQEDDAFIAGQSVFCLTRPLDIFGEGCISSEVPNFGLITWAGADANTMTGYYENCYSIAIPTFAQSAQQTAYLMYDLFKGLGEIKTYGDVIQHYRDTYFTSDIDVICLFREGARLQYSYWPNGIDNIWASITSSFSTTASIAALLEKVEHTVDTEIETYMIPNTVQLEIYRQNGLIK